MQLHGNSVSRLSGDKRNFFERQVLHIAHAHHFLISFRKPLNEKRRRPSVQHIQKSFSMICSRLIPFFKKDIKRRCFALPIFVHDKIVENVIEE